MGSDVNGNLVVPIWSDSGIAKALVDDNGRIKVTVGETTVTIDVNLKSSDITLPVEEQNPLTSIQAQEYGYVSGAWQKQPMLMGYSTAARSYITATSTAAQWVYAKSGLCPVGSIRVVEGFTMKHSGAAAQHMMAGIGYSTTYYSSIAYQSCTPNVWYGDPVQFTMRQNEFFYIAGYAAAAAVVVNGYFIARQIAIGE